MAGLHFEFTGDNTNLMAKFNEIQQGMIATRQQMTSSGVSIDNVLQAIVASAENNADAVFKMANEYKMSTATMEEKITAFSRGLKDSRDEADMYASHLKKLGEDMSQALKEGNLDSVKSLTEDIKDADRRFQEATKNAEMFSQALETLGTSTGGANAPMFFIDEGAFNRFEELKKKLDDLKNERIDIQADGGDVEALDKEILNLTDDINKSQKAAEVMAAKYGAELGGAASQAQANLYTLNAAVSDQQIELRSLEEKLKEAKEAYDILSSASQKDAQAIENASSKYEMLRDAVSTATSKLNELKAQQADASSRWAEISGQLDQHDSRMVKMLGGYDKYKQVLGNLPGPLQNVIGGINGMTGAAKAFIATPLGAVIAAIVLAVQALTSWFNSSSEGQMAFAKVSGYVSGVLDQLKEIVIWVGEALFKAFSDPKQAVIDLWEAIKSNIVTRVKSIGSIFLDLGKIISNALSFKWDEVNENVTDLGKHWVDAMTGVENSAEKISKHIANTHEIAKKNAELAERERKLAQEKSKWKVKEAELDAQIADARLKAQKGDQAATKEAEKLIKEKYATEKKFAEENLAIIKERNSLTTNNDEDYDAEHEAEAALKRLDAREKQELRYFDRRQSMLDKQATTFGNKQEEARKKLAQTMEQLEEANRARELASMEEGHKKRMAQLDHQHNEELLKIKKQAADLAKANREAGITDVNSATGLTSEQTTLIDEATELANKAYEKQVREEMKAEAQYMLDYLKEYGSFQQQKLAIAQEYAEKIRKAQESGANEWQIKTLKKERDNAVQQVDNKALAQDIDWQLVLTGFTSGFESQMRDTLSKLKDYINTPQFTGQTAENKQIIYDAIQRIEDSLPEGNGTLNIGELNRQLDVLAIKLQNTQEAAQRHNEAIDSLNEAQKSYEEAVKTGDDTLMSLAQTELDTALKNAESTREVYETIKDDAEEYSKNVRKAYNDTIGGIEGFSKGLSQLNSGSLRGAYEGLKQSVSSLRKIDLGESLNKALEKFSAALDSIPLLGGILDLLDVLKEGIGQLIGGLIDAVFDAVNGLLSDVLTGKFLVDIGESLYKGIMGLFDTLTFGGLSSLFGGDSDKNLENDIERLTASNEALRKSIDAMNEDLERASTVASYDIIKNQQNYLEKAMANTAEMMRRSASAYSNGFFGIGGDKSSNTDINKAMSVDEWRRVSEAANKSVRSAQDFFNLSSEQMWKVMKNAPDLYGKIKSYADNGYKDAAQFMDDYISYWQELNDLWDAWREKVTGTTANDIQSEFRSALLNMESDAETFGDNFSEIMRNAVINSMMDSKFSSRLEKWYENFANAIGDDGNLSESEMERLRQEYEDIANEALAWREQLFATLGLDSNGSSSDRTASTGGIAQASQDSVDELNGRITAIQGHTYILSENSNVIVSNTAQILNFIMNMEAIQNGIYVLLGLMDSRLKVIQSNTSTMIDKGVKML